MSVSAATLQKLMAAGLEGEALLEVVRSIEADAAPAKSARSERNARYYVKTTEKRLNKTSEQDAVSSSPVSPAPLPAPSSSSPPLPPLKGVVSPPDSEFDAFWRAYPHRVGKGDAKSKFAVARKAASLDELLDGVGRYIRSKPPDRPWCNPATWLHQRRWEDQPDETPITRIGPANGRPHPDQRQAARDDNLARAFAASQAVARRGSLVGG